MALTNKTIEAAKYEDKQFKLADGKGLYVLVTKAGKYFRYNYSFAKKQKTLALGVYPETTLKEAREKHAKARKLLANNIDPNEAKKDAKLNLIIDAKNSFESIALEWHMKQRNKWSERHSKSIWRRLEKNAFPMIGNTPITNIKPKDMIAVIAKVEEKGIYETAHKTLQTCRQVFSYAVIQGIIENNPCTDIKQALAPVPTKN
jgi:thiamine pyrophosphate-dependent acetolactate synthase large subunit-like protein